MHKLNLVTYWVKKQSQYGSPNIHMGNQPLYPLMVKKQHLLLCFLVFTFLLALILSIYDPLQYFF
jgi:hypothetical protein